MFKLRNDRSVLISEISSFLPEMLEARGNTNWRSPKGRSQKDNRKIIKRILETCLSAEDARIAMETVELCRTESSTGGYNCHLQSLPPWAKAFIHQCCNARCNIELALIALAGKPDATWAAGTAARVGPKSIEFEKEPLKDQIAAIERTESAGLRVNPRIDPEKIRRKKTKSEI